MVEIVKQCGIEEAVCDNIVKICDFENIEEKEFVERALILYVNLYNDVYDNAVTRLEKAANSLDQITETTLKELKKKIDEWGKL